MKMKVTLIIAVLTVLLALTMATAAAQSVITLHDASGKSWAYYPYDPAHPWTAGKWSPPGTGTGGFTVLPGTSIARQVMFNSSGLVKGDPINVSVSGLPASWAVRLYPSRFSYGVTTKNLGGIQAGYGFFYVTVPADAAPGVYQYSIAADGGGATATIEDTITVSKASYPVVLVNPGFECGLRGWQVSVGQNYYVQENEYGNYSIGVSTDAHSGRYSAHLRQVEQHDGSGGPASPRIELTQPITAHAGDTITLTFWAKAKADGLNAYVLFSDGSPISPDLEALTLSPQWKKYTITHKLISDVNGACISVQVWNTPSEGGPYVEDLYLDDFQATVTYA